MLKQLQEFRNKLDDLMHQCMDKRIVVYGYGRSGKFMAWYGEYYHGIKPDWIVTPDTGNAIPYEFPLFREQLFDFGYKDVKDAIVWLCLPETEEITQRLVSHGYVKNKTYFNIGELVYGENYLKCINAAEEVQFMRWLQQKYGCDLVDSIPRTEFGAYIEGMHGYVITTQKEIFPMLDKCHCLPKQGDAIFDFGCGKGGAMLSFLDYGFEKVGGVEYEDSIYKTMLNNFDKLEIPYNDGMVQCIHGDAALVKEELDGYNWFYFYDPFDSNIFEKVVENICESLRRKPRKIHILNINPKYRDIILNTGCFVCTNQFEINTVQRVVNLFVSKRELEGGRGAL